MAPNIRLQPLQTPDRDGPEFGGSISIDQSMSKFQMKVLQLNNWLQQSAYESRLQACTNSVKITSVSFTKASTSNIRVGFQSMIAWRGGERVGMKGMDSKW